jgi:hypothetical protein
VRKANREAGQWILGEETGGYPILNTNNPARALTGLVEEQSARYVLGFVPEREPDSPLHRLRVALAPKGLRARHRPSYYHGQSSDEMVGRTLGALVVGIEEDALGASISADVAAPSPAATTAAARGAPAAGVLRIGVPLERLSASTSESGRRIRVVIALRRGAAGSVPASDVREKWIDIPGPESRGQSGPDEPRHEIVIGVPGVTIGEAVAVGIQHPPSGLATYRRVRFEAVVQP